MAKEKKLKDPDSKVGFGKLLLWQSSAASVSIATLLIGFAQIYCTDALHVDPLAIGTIFMISKLIDSVTDVVIGYLVDRTKTKWGKGRPYEIAMVFLWLSTWALFNCPESLSQTVKYIWIFCTYTFINSVCVTCLNGNNVAYLIRAFKTKEQQTKVTAYGSVITYFFAMIFNITFPMLMGKIATSAAGWGRLVLMFAVPMVAIGSLRMLTIKEQYEVGDDHAAKKVSLRDVFEAVASNKYVVMIVVVRFLWTMITSMNAATYYWTWIVGDVGKMGMASASTVLALPITLLLPTLIKKFGMGKSGMYGFAISAVGFLLFFLAGTNVPLLIVATFLSLLGVVPFSMMGNMYIVDCSEYNEYIGKRRIEGTLGSVFGLFSKIGGAFGSFVLGLALKLGGYDGALAAQSGSALFTIRLMCGLFPFVIYAVVALILKGYKLDTLLPQMKKEREEQLAATAAEPVTE